MLEEKKYISHLELNKSCLSTLTKLFIKEAQYARITKDEALNACGLVLIKLGLEEELKEYLLDSLLSSRILTPYSDQKYLIYNINVQGILINLTKCYSPLCNTTASFTCYSSYCPNKKVEKNYFESNDKKDIKEQCISNIPHSILMNLPSRERKRQLAIEELIHYEENFLKQLAVIHNVYEQPLIMSKVTIEESRKYSFHDILFGNYHILASYHKKMLKELQSIKESHKYTLFPDSITLGNVLLKHFSKFKDIYIRYVSNYIAAKYQYSLEYKNNIAFACFIKQQEAVEKEFRIPLKDLLISPIIRLPKYDLLLSTILKYSEEDQDKTLIQTIALLTDILHKINEATRIAETEQRLEEIKASLVIKRRPSIKYQNKLQQIISDDVTLIFEGTVNLIRSPPILPTTCQLFLFNDSLLITRKRTMLNGKEEYVLIDKPIPIHMLKIENISKRTISMRQQGNVLSSIRRQLSGNQQLRRYNSDSTGLKVLPKATIDREQQKEDISFGNHNDTLNMESDDSSPIYSDVYTLSGLKLRHRIRVIKQRISKKNKEANSTFNNSNSHIKNTTSSPLLQKSASYPFSKDASCVIVKSRLLQISHMAYPGSNYLFECPTLDNRLKWKKAITSILPNPNFEPFSLKLLCSTSNYSSFQSINGMYATGCGTIWCTLPFLTSDGRGAIALGTQYGFWVAFNDASELFKQILSFNCYQLELFDNKIILVRGHKPNRVLGAVIIDHIYPPSSESITTNYDLKEFQIIQKSGILHFAVGTLRGEPILCYLRRRRTGSIRLVLMIYYNDNSTTTPWFKKVKEYKPTFIQPEDLKIIDDSIYIRSRTEGIEKIDLLNWVLGLSCANNGFQHSNFSQLLDLPAPYRMSIKENHQIEESSLITISYVPLNQPGIGLICSAQFAFPVTDENAYSFQQPIELKVNAKAMVVYYPYLIAFSPNIIEIRHLETTALVEAIPGKKIRCLYTSPPSSLTKNDICIIHVSMFHAEEDQTKVYQLYLKEQILFEN
ncbi:uncharacterized protein BX663DRAFT_504996 [Cokeromyces recurvatus]|uniref:uncharacterized protein n=1 Tax=Cokeromyces recurvatus TaxID=90255 RepID=UPI00222009CF|nr:uncharacterized protein BX663DRAFT_504996 [Cokeromyces recurvatus]KAI7904423.1 hypothetical protein BX663DRAFT_504996 [Cokeromyces recurvatus]